MRRQGEMGAMLLSLWGSALRHLARGRQLPEKPPRITTQSAYRITKNDTSYGLRALGLGVVCYLVIGNWNCNASKVSNKVYLSLAHPLSVYVVLLFEKT